MAIALEEDIERGSSPIDDEVTDEARDLYPKTEEAHTALLGWVLRAFAAAESARRPYEDKWRKQGKLYNSFLHKDPEEWRSKLFIPYTISSIEGMAPRLLSSMPEFNVIPVGPEDTHCAVALTEMLNHCSDASGLYVPLAMAWKQALKHGTGILKTSYVQDIRMVRQNVPVMVPQYASQPVMDENGMPAYDMNGEPLTEEVQVGEQPSGEFQRQQVPLEVYSGPRATWVDIYNFWVAPEAPDVQSARYTIERSFRDWAYIDELVEKGVYQLPTWIERGDITSMDDNPFFYKQSDVEMDGGDTDETRKSVELLEVFTDDGRVITVLNRRAVIRCTENPFDHGEKPYARLIDYLVEGEFWGKGEIELIEGLQDAANALINQRLDNVRINMNSVFAVNLEGIEDERDLEMAPGRIIGVVGDRDPNTVVQRIDLGDVTGSAFAEAQILEGLIERVTGMTPLQLGVDSPNYNSTATGAAIMDQNTGSKFGLKVRLVEQIGLKDLGRQWGSLIQQFTDEPRWVRVLGLDGQYTFHMLQPDALLGAVDYRITTSSSAQTQDQQRQETVSVLREVAPFAPQAVPQLLIDVLKAYDRKDIASYLGPQAQQLAQMNAMMQRMLSGEQQPGQPGLPAGGGPPQGGPPEGPPQ